MSGILNSKERIFDLYLTSQGRQQISNGQLKIEHISFSDDDTFYKADIVSGSEDARNRVFFEACDLPQDLITFESNDSGKLQPLNNKDNLMLLNGQILSGTVSDNTTTQLSGTLITQNVVFGTEFTSLASNVLDLTLNNFNNLRLLGTLESDVNNNLFQLSTEQIDFVITEENFESKKIENIKNVDSLFADQRLMQQINFKFLPPIAKRNTIVEQPKQLGSYKNWQTKTSINVVDFLKKISTSKYHKRIKISNTSTKNNLLSQFFEISNSEIKKLDVIDFGKHPVIIDKNIVWHHIFFVGKIYVDDDGNDTYINLFTIVYS